MFCCSTGEGHSNRIGSIDNRVREIVVSNVEEVCPESKHSITLTSSSLRSQLIRLNLSPTTSMYAKSQVSCHTSTHMVDVLSPFNYERNTCE